jgi:hypothetical protein
MSALCVLECQYFYIFNEDDTTYRQACWPRTLFRTSPWRWHPGAETRSSLTLASECILLSAQVSCCTHYGKTHGAADAEQPDYICNSLHTQIMFLWFSGCFSVFSESWELADVRLIQAHKGRCSSCIQCRLQISRFHCSDRHLSASTRITARLPPGSFKPPATGGLNEPKKRRHCKFIFITN